MKIGEQTRWGTIESIDYEMFCVYFRVGTLRHRQSFRTIEEHRLDHWTHLLRAEKPPLGKSPFG